MNQRWISLLNSLKVKLSFHVVKIIDWRILVDPSGNGNKGDITIQHHECPGAEIQVHYEISGFPPSSEACAVVFIRDSDMPSLRDALIAQAVVQMKAIQDFAPFLERTLAAKAFVSYQSSTRGSRMSIQC
jgi:hypothetical protein